MDKVLFIIYEDEIRFVPNKAMSCKEYYISLGGTLKEYDNLIRGMISEGKILFMKSNYRYDNDVIEIAKKCAPIIKEQLQMPHLITCCGIVKGIGNMKWRPALVLDDDNSSLSDEQKELLNQVEYQVTKKENPIIEIKNDISDSDFAKYAARFSTYLLIATIAIKVFLYFNHQLDLSNQFIIIVVATQIIALLLSIISYKKQRKRASFYGLVAAAALFLMMNLYDIIVGSITLLFTVDQTYIVHILDFFHRLFHKKKKTKV